MAYSNAGQLYKFYIKVYFIKRLFYIYRHGNITLYIELLKLSCIMTCRAFIPLIKNIHTYKTILYF